MRNIRSHPSEKLPQPPNRDDVYATLDSAIPFSRLNNPALVASDLRHLWWMLEELACPLRVICHLHNYFFFFLRRDTTRSRLVRVFFVANRRVHFARTR